MFKRKRSQRVHPDVLVQDAYIKRRYEDLSVCIHKDIKNGSGLYNYYAPWLEMKLQSFPAQYREKHSVMQSKDHGFKIHHPSTDAFTKSEASVSSAPSNAWVQEANVEQNRCSTHININTTLPIEDGVVLEHDQAGIGNYAEDKEPVRTTSSSVPKQVSFQSEHIRTTFTDPETATGTRSANSKTSSSHVERQHGNSFTGSKFCVIL